MKQRVYLETSIISYLAARPSRDLVLAGRQEVTRLWWEKRRPSFEIYVSQLVLEESGGGDVEAASRRIEVLANVTRLQSSEEAAALAEALVDAHALPQRGMADALHIAIAAVSGMDYLLTWNCRHIANAELIPAIRDTIEEHGYEAPVICTPDELMGDEP